MASMRHEHVAGPSDHTDDIQSTSLVTPMKRKALITVKELMANMRYEHVTGPSNHTDDIQSTSLVTPMKRKLGEKSPQQTSSPSAKKRVTFNRS